ncbi:YcjX family protein [Siccirubricoccus sp. G192]|uniref:YcjX family protein n=1 Tax=Siccirubricoccus sp. G192 TaxID=2849651 RepID=UPI001C2C6A23|nr:YcjX family protein [Siccirubricoccus sp. G192]MBV1798328.1 YcjX family protein [Siccirubricoccus sp. G192]
MASLTDPLGLLRDAAMGAEQLGRGLLGQERIRLAVTGLTRAGKTVFLTSLLANLLAAGQGRRTLPALEAAAGGRLRGVRLVPAGIESLPRFDVAAHLAALAADPPAWPGRTEDLSTLELTLEVERRSWLGGLLGSRSITLELLDYPGEWLLDLPMLSQDFAEWSAATLQRLRRGPRAEAARDFLAFVDALPAGTPDDEALARRGFILYRDALRHCRDRLGLRFLQPGRVLNPGPRGEAPILWFFPLPHPEGSGLAMLLARRHAAYVADQRDNFFEPYFRRFQRQAVLVDVLGALHAGQEAFEDTAEALAAIAAALRYGGSWLDRLTGAGVDRAAFVATKADHVPGRQRDALAALLGALVAAPQNRAEGAGAATAVHAIAAIRCTEDDVVTLEGRPVAAVRGVLLRDGRSARIYPGEVPLRPPEPGFWDHGFFEMPEFQPPRLDAQGVSGVPHLGLDSLLAWLIGDLL